MRTRGTVALSLLACVIAVAGLLPSAAAAAPGQKTQNTASESYYRLDVPNGTVTARIEATVQNAATRDMTTAVLWAMPRAQNILVTRDDQPLAIAITPFVESLGLPAKVEVTLPRALKPKTQMDLVMTYDVPPQTSELVRLEPGATEALFVSQGPGSFVFVDLPVAAENYLDPGCLKADDQPGDVTKAGLERWVCGEVTLIAFAADDPDLLKRCAQLDDRCRQRLDASPFSAFVQSVSDASLLARLEADIPLQAGTVKLTLRYFRRDQAWADRQFQVAQAALPILEATFGYPYAHDTITMRQSHHIELGGAAGLAFSDIGEVLLAVGTTNDAGVTVHELAHQWAGFQLETSWLWEGLAEWGAGKVDPQVGVAPLSWAWQATGYTDPLATWHAGSNINAADYWYGKAGAFWNAYEAAIGGSANMTAVLSQIDDYTKSWPLDGEWFMDRGEEVSAANLDELFLSWVFNRQTAAPLLAERRAAHDTVAPLRARAAEFGFTGIPDDIQDNLNHWTFRAVEGQVAEANRVLDDYAKLVEEATAAGLPPVDNVKNSWNTGTMRETAGVIADQRQALDAIVNSTKVLEDEQPGSPALKQLAESREKYAEGDLDEAARLAAMSATTAFNQEASLKLIALAKEKQANLHPSFLGRIGLIGQDPAGQLRHAEEAYAAGDPNKAMELAQSAYKTWNAAERTGLQRLAILMGAMCLLSGGVFWLLRRLDGPDLKIKIDPYAARGGHNIGDPETRRPSWRDWENSKD